MQRDGGLVDGRPIEQILESQRQWQETIDAIADYIFVIGADRSIRRVNLAFSKRFSRHPREIVGGRINELFHLPVPHEGCVIDRAIDEKVPVLDEIQIGGETFMVSVFPSVLGGDEVYVCIMKDITEMKRLREKVFQSYKLASIGRLVSGVAHEINNPLTGIVGFAELIAIRSKEEHVRREAEKIGAAAERCRKIVESLLCFSRQQKSERSLEYVNDIMEKALDLRAYWLRARHIDVRKIYGELPLSYVDIQQLQQAFVNILVNAEQAMSECGRPGQLVITTSYEPAGRLITVRIADNGCGVPQENCDKIFDPFFTTKPVDVGTGLGLSITYGIVASHGGTIRVESVEGEGSCFVIEIPARQKIDADEAVGG